MSAAATHLEIEVLYGTLCQPLCENNAGVDAFDNLDDDVEMTTDEAEVTCDRCLEAMGAVGSNVVKLPPPFSIGEEQAA